MGQALEVACITCKKVYYIGYGRPNKWPQYTEVYEAHKGHEVKDLWTDYLTMRGDDLVNDHPYELLEDQLVVVEGYKHFEYINEEGE